MRKDKREVLEKLLNLSLLKKLPESLLYYCSPFTSSDPNGNTTLIPRQVFTHIQVFPFRVDMKMDNHSQRHTRPTQSMSQSVQENSILHAAIVDHNPEMVKKILMENPELIETYDEEGRTPVSCAAYYGYVDIVEYLVQDFPKSISKSDKDKSFAIHKACLRGHIDVLKAFHAKSDRKYMLKADNRGRTILHLAVKNGNRLRDVVSYLVSLDGIRDQLLRQKDENGLTPLDLAQNANNYPIVDILKSNNA